MFMSAHYNTILWQIRYFRAMWHNPRNFTLVFCLLAWAASIAAQETSLAAAVTAPTLTAQQLITQSGANLLKLTGLEAEFRYRVHLYGESLQGTGNFRHLGEGPEKQFRLEMRTQLEESVATQQIICGTQYLWIRREIGEDKKPLVRVNLRKLRKTLQDAGPPLAEDPTPTWASIVSLPKLLGSLGIWFKFAPPEEAKISNRLVWQLRGEINQELRDKLLVQGRVGDTVGEQIPDQVRLTLGRDEALPLFPYRLEFLQRDANANSLKPLLSLEFYSVKVKSDFDPQLFDYAPGDQEVEDQTILFLQRLGFIVKE